ncbi:MAG: branched-chain amino acid ABC transporter permease [Gammaproteobacteria bacterium]|nr:branched-chain amino acid ABC transporter permease [Gammaproteobacteria bacterium]
MELIFIQSLNAIQYGLLLFLVAAGLTLVFGMMNVINLAHGSFYMVGAYLAYSLTHGLPREISQHFSLVLLLGVFIAVGIGFAIEWLFFRFLYARDHLQQVLLTYGLILVLEEVRSIVVDNDVHSIDLPLKGSINLGGIMEYPYYHFVVSSVCLLLVLIMFVVFYHTRLGMRLRAASSNPEMLQVLGVNVKLLMRLVFAAGFGLAAFAGMLYAPISTVYPGMGNGILILSFVVVVIGGIGSVWGALLVALIIGFIDTFAKIFFPIATGVLTYMFMALVLLYRPQGLFRVQ